MADVHNKQTRSFNMSRIRGRDTKPELLVRKYLFSKGFRYKLHVKQLPGTPDLVLPRLMTVIFVHGCFWHGHEGCDLAVTPKTRRGWWADKIKGTQERDAAARKALQKMGYFVHEIFECDIRPKTRDVTLSKLSNLLNAE